MPQRSATLLTDAAALIEEFMGGLDTSSSPCSCCTLTVYANLHEARVHAVLSGVVTKLNRNAAEFLKAENTQA